MKFKDECVYFKSTSNMYRREKSGRKNNTVRIMSESEWNLIRWKVVRRIEIIDPVNDVSFRRDVGDITEIGNLLGMHIVVFTWERQKEKDD